MFTGLVQDMGTVGTVEQRKGEDRRFWIDTPLPAIQKAKLGASIACSGCCLTLIDKDDHGFAVEVSGESLSKTTIGNWQEGTRINLEPSLKLGDEMGGHIVSGHVDGLAEIIAITPENGSHRLKIKTPQGYAPYVAEKGSVALDGISLTVNEVEGDIFGVNIIPHTWDVTTLQDRKVGDKLHFEADTIARYVARMLEFKSTY